eukprot:CAMPEP_0184532016 /NCGR_PEP_ID=MMETSP0198_2-20121128/13906_1 /TAXON_ID=1112570 /ORGANISM="Thraustochytrium sp., Strain LLF1b" /LENGTH=58 /DNA_ID=CAMNT_0026924513 /DNA_START=411 /DNA_END=587 /DNA_ORIENTATION=+
MSLRIDPRFDFRSLLVSFLSSTEDLRLELRLEDRTDALRSDLMDPALDKLATSSTNSA